MSTTTGTGVGDIAGSPTQPEAQPPVETTPPSMPAAPQQPGVARPNDGFPNAHTEGVARPNDGFPNAHTEGVVLPNGGAQSAPTGPAAQ